MSADPAPLPGISVTRRSLFASKPMSATSNDVFASIVYGPNTNLGGSSIINMMESQSRFIRQLVEVAAQTGSVAVKPETESAFDTEIQQRIASSVWGGCDSWYRDAGGRVTTNWPGTVVEYKERTAEVDLDDFVLGATA